MRKKVLEFMKENKIRSNKTTSDCGMVKFGNDGFTISIPNGYGDGSNLVYVVDLRLFQEMKNKLKSGYIEQKELFSFGSLHKKFNLYKNDCGPEEILKTLEGDYFIYGMERLIILVRY